MKSRLSALIAVSLFAIGWLGWSRLAPGEPASLGGAAHEVLVRNGGFEVGFVGWEERDGNGRPGHWLSVGGCQSGADIVNQTRKYGSNCLHITNRSPRTPHVFGTIYQTVAIVPGQRYRLTLWARARELASDGGVNIAVDKQWRVRPVHFPKGTYDWTLLSGEFSLPVSSIRLRIISEDVGEVWVDDIRMEPIRDSVAVKLRQHPLMPPSRETTTLNLPMDASASHAVSPEAGADVALDDGARVHIPEDAVANETKVTIGKLQLTGPEAKSSRVYEITLAGKETKLTKPATLVLPFEANDVPANAPDSCVKVAVLEPEQGWVQVPAKVNRNTGTATLQTDHFSTWRIFWTGKWARETSDKTKVVLPVPYYPQGDSGWCWAASTQMLLKFYGRDMEIWRIAETFGNRYEDGLNAFTFMAGAYSHFLEIQGLQVEQSVVGWADLLELTGYIMYQVRQGRPVWLGLPNIGHAVIVVGFDETGIYINDPSGCMVDKVKGINETNVRHLNPVKFTWSEWYEKALTKSVITAARGLLGKHTLVVVGRAPARSPAATLSVLNDRIRFRAPKPAWAVGTPGNSFRWDGTRKPDGYLFTGLDQKIVGSPDNNPGNSDTLSKFIVTLANSEDTAFPESRVSVQLFLDGQSLEKQTQRVELPAQTSNININLMQKQSYDFLGSPLRPGLHSFKAVLKIDDRIVDEANIKFTMAPAQPTGLDVQRTGDKVKLTWDPNLEASRGLARISYQIWKDGQVIGTSTRNSWETNSRFSILEEPTPLAPMLRDSQKLNLRNFAVEAVVADAPNLNSILSDAVAPKRADVGPYPWVGTWIPIKRTRLGQAPITISLDTYRPRLGDEHFGLYSGGPHIDGTYNRVKNDEAAIEFQVDSSDGNGHSTVYRKITSTLRYNPSTDRLMLTLSVWEKRVTKGGPAEILNNFKLRVELERQAE